MLLRRKIIVVSNDDEIYHCVQKAIIENKHRIDIYKMKEKLVYSSLEAKAVVTSNLKRRRSDHKH